MTVQPRVVAVAASGGRDSTALLHATARAAQGLGVNVVALHVHHGLSPAADDWQLHLQRQCARWARAGLPIQLHTTRLAGAPARGESIEAWARRGRYAALAQMAREAGARMVLLAHHRRDQAETLLLQALRGAGPMGLAAMPREAEREGLRWCRPWLEQPAEAIAAYIARHRLTHIDDDSNQDTRFDRNRLRHDVWPALLAAFAHAEAGLTQAARLSQQAAALVGEVAQADLAALQDDSGAGIAVAAWKALSPVRQAAVLRHWLRPAAEEGVRESLIERLVAELPTARAARWPLDAARELRLYRGRLTLAGLAPPTAATVDPMPPRLDQPGRIELPAWGGTLELAAVEQGGASRSLLARAGLRERQPGDQFQLAPRSMARGLKKQFQAIGVPAWQRGGPIVAAADRVIFVPGLGIDARAVAAPGEPQLAIRWEPAA